MRRLSILAVLSLAVRLVAASDEATKTPLAEKCRTLVAEYRTELAALAKARYDRSSVEAARKSWSNRFDAIIEEARQLGRPTLSADDLAAVAEVAELNQRAAVVREFASAAVALEPGLDRAYFPLIRAMLNEKEYSEAEETLRRAIAANSGNQASRIRALHGHFYVQYRALGRFQESAPHADEFISYLASRIDNDPEAAVILATHAERYLSLQRSVNREAAGIERLQGAYEKSKGGVLQPGAGDKTAQLRLRCELARLLEPDIAPSLVEGYLGQIRSNVQEGQEWSIVASDLRWLAAFTARLGDPSDQANRQTVAPDGPNQAVSSSHE